MIPNVKWSLEHIQSTAKQQWTEFRMESNWENSNSNATDKIEYKQDWDKRFNDVIVTGIGFIQKNIIPCNLFVKYGGGWKCNWIRVGTVKFGEIRAYILIIKYPLIDLHNNISQSS